MFERYSELSLRAIDMSLGVARLFLSEVVRDEHLLLGVVGAGNGTAAQALKCFNVGYKQIHDQMKELTVIGTTSGGELPFDITGKRTLEKAWLAAREYNHKKVYTGHILIGVLALGSGLVDILLQNLLINKLELREKIIEVFDDLNIVASEETTPSHGCMSSKVADYLSAETIVALTFAEQEARRSGVAFIGTEHILMGLFLQETGAAAQTLRSYNVTIEALRHANASITGLGSGWTPRQLPLTRRAVKILEAALSQAVSLGQERIQTENVLLAISRSDGGLAPRILQDLGVKLIAT